MRSQDLIEERIETLRRLYKIETDSETKHRLSAGIRTLFWVLEEDDAETLEEYV